MTPSFGRAPRPSDARIRQRIAELLCLSALARARSPCCAPSIGRRRDRVGAHCDAAAGGRVRRRQRTTRKRSLNAATAGATPAWARTKSESASRSRRTRHGRQRVARRAAGDHMSDHRVDVYAFELVRRAARRRSRRCRRWAPTLTSSFAMARRCRA